MLHARPTPRSRSPLGFLALPTLLIGGNALGVTPQRLVGPTMTLRDLFGRRSVFNRVPPVDPVQVLRVALHALSPNNLSA
jgi:hypothetical protein